VTGESREKERAVSWPEWRFVLLVGLLALAVASIPYVLGAMLATDDRPFGGFVYALQDCYSYLAKMRQGAEGGWLFHIAYTPEPHMGTLFFPFHLLLGKAAALLLGGSGPPALAADLTARMVWVYHAARWVFGLGLLLTVYRFFAAFTERVLVRRLAWLMVTFGGGLGWLLAALGQSDWLGSTPLDFILPEGFTFLVLYAFPHIALARTLLLWGMLFLLRAWRVIPRDNRASHSTHLAAMTGASWLAMGLIVPFYVAVAWAVMGTAWLVLSVRHRRAMWREAWAAGLAGLISAPVVCYSAWVFTSDPVYVTWSSQNLILSPHPLHYLAAYGAPLALAAFAVRESWRSEGPKWLALAWVGLAPVLVYLPVNLQRRLVEGVQAPLSLLAALGFAGFGLRGLRRRLAVAVLLVGLSLTNVLLAAGNCLALRGQPTPIYRDAAEVAALDWLGERIAPDEVVLSSYETGNYLPARARARVFVGHGPETIRFGEKQALVSRFFDAQTGDAWRRYLLEKYGIDYVFWGPEERKLGGFEPDRASYLISLYEARGYAVFEVGE